MAGKVVVPDKDARDPQWVRIHLNRLYDQSFSLLGRIAELETSVRSDTGTVGGLTDADRRLLQALARGSSESSVPGTKPVVPIVSALPATSTATPGELVDFGGTIYEFTGSAWVTISAAAAAHNILSATHGDSLAAAVVRGDLIAGNATPRWSRLAKGAALNLLRMNAGATDPEWGIVDPTVLSGLTSFELLIANVGGTIKHQILTDAQNAGTVGSFVGKINGASAVSTATPSVNNVTPFATGAGIDAANTYRLVFDVAAQTIGSEANIAALSYNDTGTVITVASTVLSINVNGVTRNRLELWFRNATTGATIDLSAASAVLVAGKTIGAKFLGFVA